MSAASRPAPEPLDLTDPEYHVAFTESELRALRAVAHSPIAAAIAEQIVTGAIDASAIVSAVDKLDWAVDFLDEPVQFAGELSAMRVLS